MNTPSHEYLKRHAFTLLELVMLVAVTGILAGLLFPTLQAARESGRRNDCAARMKQSVQACHSYHEVHKAFPAGAYMWESNKSYGQNWCVQIPPFVGQAALYGNLKSTIRNQMRNAELANTTVEDYEKYKSACQIPVAVFSCPSDPGSHDVVTLNPSSGPSGADTVTPFALSSQIALAGRSLGIAVPKTSQPGNGAFTPYGWFADLPNAWLGILHVVGDKLESGSFVSASGHYEGRSRSFKNATVASVTDGLSNTAMISERHFFEPTWERRSTFWALSYAAFSGGMAMNVSSTLNTQRTKECHDGVPKGLEKTQTCYNGIGTFHYRGANVAMADGRVKFQADTTDLDIWCATAAMADGGVVELP